MAIARRTSLEVVRQLVEDDQVLAIVSPFGTPTNAAIQKYLNTSNVPQLLVQSGASRWNSPKAFPWTTPYSPFYDTEGENFANYLCRTSLARKSPCFISRTISAEITSKGLREGLGEKAAAIDRQGSKVIKTTDPTIDSQILILKDSGAVCRVSGGPEQIYSPGDTQDSRVGLEAAAIADLDCKFGERRAGAGRA